MTMLPMSPAGSAFERVFGAAPSAMAMAHGRVNLVGDHTDYHQGFVLPMPIAQQTVVHVRGRSDYIVRAMTTAMTPTLDEYVLGEEAPGFEWLDYVQGVTSVLARNGHCVMGFDVGIESSVPTGAGVSSSAALSVALLRALRLLFRLHMTDLEIATLAQKVETQFVGAPVGIMDPMSCSLGRPGEALFIDTRSLAHQRIAWPLDIDVAVINSGVSHAHAGGPYAVRRKESFAAAALLGVRWLRDATLDMLSRTDMPDTLLRRARHVITENQRVRDAVHSLQHEDAERLGALFVESHVSMRDDYEVSVPEIDMLVALARGDDDVYGARLTGGGFGGCVVVLARSGRGAAAGRRIIDSYNAMSGRTAALLVPEQSGALRPATEA